MPLTAEEGPLDVRLPTGAGDSGPKGDRENVGSARHVSRPAARVVGAIARGSGRGASGGFAASRKATSTRRTTEGAVTAPRIRRGPPQRSHTRTLIANTRWRSRAHVDGLGERALASARALSGASGGTIVASAIRPAGRGTRRQFPDPPRGHGRTPQKLIVQRRSNPVGGSNPCRPRRRLCRRIRHTDHVRRPLEPACCGAATGVTKMATTDRDHREGWTLVGRRATLRWATGSEAATSSLGSWLGDSTP